VKVARLLDRIASRVVNGLKTGTGIYQQRTEKELNSVLKLDSKSQQQPQDLEAYDNTYL